MKKTYSSINATFGSAALDLSTLPAYQNRPLKGEVPIIQFDDIAPSQYRYRTVEIKRSFSLKAALSSLVSFLRNDLYAPPQKVDIKQVNLHYATKKEAALLYAIGTVTSVILILIGA
ncbi:MAG: hypothetical protein ACI4BI_02815 [Anaerotardibacter sp.]